MQEASTAPPLLIQSNLTVMQEASTARNLTVMQEASTAPLLLIQSNLTVMQEASTAPLLL